jgi:hypothetical protein
MSSATFEQARVLTAEKQRQRAKRAKKMHVAGWIGLATVPGTAIGIGLGIHNANGDAANLEKAQTRLTTAEGQLLQDQGKLSSYNGVLPQSCRKALATYLNTGANHRFSTPQAQISLQQSGLCPPTEITLVADTRNLEAAVGSDQSTLKDKRENVRDAQNDLNSDSELLAGALLGTVVEPVVLGAGTLLVAIISIDSY